MSTVTVFPASTTRQRRLFLELPWRLCRADPNWVPPLRGEQKALVGYKRHPFYERNEVETFLAVRGKEVCGRIAAIHNRVHNEQHGERRGFVGFFESVDDQEVASALFEAARAWLAERGLEGLRGPVNPSLHYTVGLLVDGFDSPPTFMMTYNPPYYPRLFERHGFQKSQDLYAYYGHVDMLPSSSAKLGPIADQIIERYGIKTRTLDASRFREDVETFLHVYNKSLVGTWGFAPMSDAEVKRTAAGLRHLIVPEMAAAAEIDGKVVGVVFCLPDYNPVIRAIDGRLFPFGFLRLLRAKRRIKRVRLLAANVVPEYQLLGVGLVLLRALVPQALELGYREVEYSWVLESNRLSRGSLEKGGARRIKTYRVYDWDP